MAVQESIDGTCPHPTHHGSSKGTYAYHQLMTDEKIANHVDFLDRCTRHWDESELCSLRDLLTPRTLILGPERQVNGIHLTDMAVWMYGFLAEVTERIAARRTPKALLPSDNTNAASVLACVVARRAYSITQALKPEREWLILHEYTRNAIRAAAPGSMEPDASE